MDKYKRWMLNKRENSFTGWKQIFETKNSYIELQYSVGKTIDFETLTHDI